MYSRYIRKVKAFTTVEIMIALTIVSVLLAASIPKLTRARANAHISSCGQNIRSIALAYEMYQTSHHNSPGKGAEAIQKLVETGYMKAIPKCPATGTADYYLMDARDVSSNRGYAIFCDSGGHIKITGCKDSFPTWRSLNGLYGLYMTPEALRLGYGKP